MSALTKAVFFDVDFTLIYPGPTFRGEGYREFCARHGIEVDASTFSAAVAGAAPLLDGPEDAPYTDEIFIVYTRRIIEGMGGRVRISTPARARFTRNGRRASTSRCTTMCRTSCASCRRRACASD